MFRGASGWESMVSSWQENIAERDAANMYINLFMTVRFKLPSDILRMKIVILMKFCLRDRIEVHLIRP